jgi:hypothetical protein
MKLDERQKHSTSAVQIESIPVNDMSELHEYEHNRRANRILKLNDNEVPLVVRTNFQLKINQT